MDSIYPLIFLSTSSGYLYPSNWHVSVDNFRKKSIEANKLFHESSRLNPEYVLPNCSNISLPAHDCNFLPSVCRGVSFAQLFFAWTFQIIIRRNKSLTMPLSIFLAKNKSPLFRYLATPRNSNQKSCTVVKNSSLFGLGVLVNPKIIYSFQPFVRC